MEFSPEKFNKIKKEAEVIYDTNPQIPCPYFNNEKVHFNTKGFDHLIFKGFNRTRPIADQFSRFKYLHFVFEIIRNSKTLQGYQQKNKIERVRRNQKWEKIMRSVTYYEFIAIVESNGSKVRLKIVVKQVEGAEKHFLSIIPFWGIDKMTGDRKLFSGNPEND